jgi:hypothetical protein
VVAITRCAHRRHAGGGAACGDPAACGAGHEAPTEAAVWLRLRGYAAASGAAVLESEFGEVDQPSMRVIADALCGSASTRLRGGVHVLERAGEC